ncbi:MAG: mechanosensitive ion channel family protein [Bacillota bacterium]
MLLALFQDQSFSEKLLWFIGLSAAGWILTKVLLFVWVKLIMPFAMKTESSLDDHLAKNLHKPVSRLLILGSIYLAAKLTIASAKEVSAYVDPVENFLYLVLVFLLAMLADAVLKSFIDWYLEDIGSKTESALDDTLFPILRKAGAVIIYFIAATVILGRFQVNLTGFLATAGVASLAIAFGAQETLANIIAGISILVDRSFHIGERVELKDGLIGDVMEIGLRSTRIMSLDQRLIIVPNKEIAGSRLINWSQPNTATKIKLKIGVGMDEDLGRVKKIIADVCAKEATLSKKEPASVVCTAFGPYFIEILVVATVDDCRTTGGATDKLIIALQEAFKKENVSMPFPTQQIMVQK